MSKKVTFNGIELSLPKYDEATRTLFAFVETIISRLEEGLDTNDGNFQLSISVDFSASNPPSHSIVSSNGATAEKTRNKVEKILSSSVNGGFNQVSGSMKVNLVVEDK